MTLCSLYQATHAEVMFSRSASVRMGPLPNGGTFAYALGLVQPDRGFAEPVVQDVADGADRCDQSFEHQCLAVMYSGVLTSGVAVVDRVIERVTLAGAEGCGVAQRALDEAGVLDP
jgi:hypothetical protein